MVGIDGREVERALVAGELDCPCCGDRLVPWGWGRWRPVRLWGGVEERRRPRRSRCSSCKVTHVLLWADSLLRRRDGVAVIGAALTARARGASIGAVAAAVAGVAFSTVRGWLRRFAVNAESVRARFTVLAHDLDPLLDPILPTGTGVGDAVEAIGVAAQAAARRLGPVEAWSLAASGSGGRLLANTGCP